MEKTVVFLKEYGKIELRLKEMLEKRNMTRNYLARAINSRFEVVDRWCKGEIEQIDTDILARICYVLDCEVKDLIGYKKG